LAEVIWYQRKAASIAGEAREVRHTIVDGDCGEFSFWSQKHQSSRAFLGDGCGGRWGVGMRGGRCRDDDVLDQSLNHRNRRDDIVGCRTSALLLQMRALADTNHLRQVPLPPQRKVSMSI